MSAALPELLGVFRRVDNLQHAVETMLHVLGFCPKQRLSSNGLDRLQAATLHSTCSPTTGLRCFHYQYPSSVLYEVCPRTPIVCNHQPRKFVITVLIKSRSARLKL